MSEVTTDPIIVAATALLLAFGLGYVMGRVHRSQVNLSFDVPDGTKVNARVNKPDTGYAESVTPGSHVDWGE